MMVPIMFRVRRNSYIPVVKVVGECEAKYPFIFLWEVTLKVINVVEEMKGIIIPSIPSEEKCVNNTVFFMTAFPDMKTANDFCKRIKHL